MRYHIRRIDKGAEVNQNLCGSPGEAHSTDEPLSPDDYWCSLCARIFNLQS